MIIILAFLPLLSYLIGLSIGLPIHLVIVGPLLTMAIVMTGMTMVEIVEGEHKI